MVQSALDDVASSFCQALPQGPQTSSHTITILVVCAMMMVLISGAFSPQVNVSSLSPDEREDIRTANLKSSLLAGASTRPLFQLNVSTFSEIWWLD
jgi:hypothetical protein